ncbi:MAG: DUF3226 domain-containing protein [Scytonema sp. PMC 1070.18]|nr:DUF3226 domain-containing protein [Scytonema sp. PMC 1070.18]
MNRRCALIGVEGNHDQAFLSRILRKLLGFSEFNGTKSELEPLWRKFIPQYPTKTGKLYTRLPMPSILYTDSLSVAIYVGEGSNLIENLADKLTDISDYSNALFAFAIVVDADKNSPAEVAQEYHNGLKDYFSDFPSAANKNGTVVETLPRLGLYILPNNQDRGVLDTLICACGEVAYPEYMNRAISYINQFSDEEIKQIKWKPFDRDKAIVATVTSVLKPGKTNTTSIKDDQWVSLKTEQQVSELRNLTDFLKKLLNL